MSAEHDPLQHVRKERDSVAENSEQVLETVRQAIQREVPVKTALESVANNLTFERVSEDELRRYFGSSLKEKVALLSEGFPQGLLIQEVRTGANGTYTVGWEHLVPYEAYFLKNHGQPLLALARRGGRSVLEVYAALEGKKNTYDPASAEAQAVANLQKLGFLNQK